MFHVTALNEENEEEHEVELEQTVFKASTGVVELSGLRSLNGWESCLEMREDLV